MKFLRRFLNGHYNPELEALKDQYSESVVRRQAASKKLTQTAENIIRRANEDELAKFQFRARTKGAL
jgi:hypothetical protein